MALFSEMDWLVIAAVAAFLFFGPQGQQFVRQMGRWYARMLKLKAEILSEVTSSAGLPSGAVPSTGSIRSAILGTDALVEPSVAPSPAPSTVSLTTPAGPGVITQVQPVGVWAVQTQTLGAGMGPETWWVATTSVPGEVVRLR